VSHDALTTCPHCGGALLVRALHVACDDDRARSTSTSTSTRKRTAPAPPARTSTAPTPDDVQAAPQSAQRALPLPPALAKTPATTWKRAIAIAHRVIEQWPESGASQTDAFKDTCDRQGIDYAEIGTGGRPLYARALDYVQEQRRRRAGGDR